METNLDENRLQSLLEDLIKNPDSVKDLSYEEANAVRKHINPYGVLNKDEKWFAVMITNQKEKFMERVMMTSLVSFLFRTQEEYDPDNQDNILNILSSCQVPYNDYLTCKNEYDKIQQKFTELEKDLGNQAYKEVITTFQDPSGTLTPEFIKEHKAKTKSQKKRDKQRQRKGKGPEVNVISESTTEVPNITPHKVMHPKLQEVNNELKVAEMKLNMQEKVINNSFNKFLKGELLNYLEYFFKYNPKVHLKKAPTYDEKRTYKDPDRQSNITPQTNPPVEAFHWWQKYHTGNYDRILEEVLKLYSEKPDIDFMINILNSFEDSVNEKGEVVKGSERAKEWILGNKRLINLDCKIVKQGSPHLLMSYAKNNNRIHFFSENMEIIQEMIKHQEEDEKVVQDLLQHKVKKVTKKNTKDVGEIPESFHDFIKENKPEIDKFASMDREEIKKLEKKKLIERDEPTGSSSNSASEDLFLTKDGRVLKENEVVELPIYNMNPETGILDKQTVYLEAEAPKKISTQ